MTKLLLLREQVGLTCHYYGQLSQLTQSTKVGGKAVAIFLPQPMGFLLCFLVSY